jgi:glucose/arabinose dehydrogenase
MPASPLRRGATLSLAAFALSAAVHADPTDQPVRKGRDAFGDWTTDAPGVRRHITVADLVPPFDSPSVDNGPRMVKRPKDAMPQVPKGFAVEMLLEGLNNPRKIIAAPNGDIFIAESEPGRVRVVRLGADNKVVKNEVFADHLRQPFGIAFYPPGPEPKFVYIGNTDSVVRFAYAAGDLKASGKPETMVSTLPGGGRLRGGGHWTRDVVFNKDGSKMYVSVGSLSNNDDNPEQEKHRAAVLEFNPDGSDFRVFASGIRNSVGLAIEPVTGKVWGSVNERDGLGDDIPFEYITHFEDGGFYGWPFYYIGNHPDPRHKGKHPELGEKTIVPDVLVQAHSASLCLTFYTASQFPARYSGWAFAAEHGSWNRAKRTGYKVIGIPMTNGKATGEYEDFLVGFVTDAGNVWGRPVGVTVDKTGAMIVSDDGGNRLWRISYTGNAPAPTSTPAATDPKGGK